MVPALAALLERAVEPLQGVAVSVGPGAFTGLRVGLAVATGLALSRGVPVYALGSLAARATLCPDLDDVLVLLDARKSRHYGARFSTHGAPVCRSGPVDAPLETLLDALSPGHAVTGEGAAAAAAALEARGLKHVVPVEANPALALARLASSGALEPCDPGAVRLQYVRPPDAKVPRRLSLLPPEA
jgi:tRNA threonylcarbamoyladenosine biosynthesis protein TsaB